MTFYPELGAGMLIHNSKRYTDFLEIVGPHVDVYELIMGQYDEDPDTINRLKEQLDKPFLMHNSFFSFGTDIPTDQKLMAKINDRVGRSDAAWVSDHLCYTGVPGTYSGALLPPILDEKHLDVFIRRVNEAQALVKAPIIIENVVLHYKFGNMPYAEFLTRLAEETDIGILISVENITQCLYYSKVDHFDFIDALPADRIVQIHCTMGNLDEQKQITSKYFGTLDKKQQLHYEVLEYIAKTKQIKPKAMIWELETETEALPDPAMFVERLEWAKNLFGYESKEVVAK